MKTLTVLLAALLLSSCVSIRYGAFTHVPQGRDVYLAQDAVSQLTKLYPPAQNTFCLGQRVGDSFGISLIYEIRKKGYGVIENCPKQRANFFYVVDEIKLSNFYRVSFYVQSETLSRVYANTSEKFTPVSAWSHKE